MVKLYISSPPFPFLPLRSLSLPSAAFPPLIEVGPLNPAGSLGGAVSSPSGVWGGAPAEIEFGTFKPYNLISGGNNCNDFPENQLTKKCSVDHQDEAILQ